MTEDAESDEPIDRGQDEWQRRIDYSRLASYYHTAFKEYKSLINILGGKQSCWPKVSRPVKKEDDTDFNWFCDYFGTALSLTHDPVLYPLPENLARSALWHAVEHFIERNDEFAHLRKGITEQMKLGQLDAITGDKALKKLDDLEGTAKVLVEEIKIRVKELPREKIYMPPAASDLSIVH